MSDIPGSDAPAGRAAGAAQSPFALRPARPSFFRATSIDQSPSDLSTTIAQGVPTLFQSPAVQVANVRLLRPELGDLIATVRLPDRGIPRDQVTVPIAPVADVSDLLLFEQAADPAHTSYLPRYRLKVVNQQYQMVFAQGAQGWSLAVHFEKYPAEEIAELARSAAEVTHDVAVILTYRVITGDSLGSQKELVFQEVTAEEGGLLAVLRGNSLPERDLLYQVMTRPEYRTTLTVRRALRVAVPAPDTGVVSKPLRPILKLGPNGLPQLADGVLILFFDQLMLFREVTRVLDNPVDPNPWMFPPDLYAYIFRNITPSTGTSFAPIRRQVSWNGNFYSYYQDPAEPYLFAYLPDSFKISRRPRSPYYPIMSVRFSTTDGTMMNIRATLEYAAIPVVDPRRIQAAVLELQRYITDPLPAGVSGPQLEPLLADTVRFLLALPGANPGSGPYQEHTGAIVDLRSGIHDSLTFSLEEFQALFDAMFSPTSILFSGQVEVKLGENQKEAIPFIARMDNLAGEVFEYREVPDPSSGGVAATFRNAIESPVIMNSLNAKLQSGATMVSAHIQESNFAFPLQIQPGEEQTFIVVPETPISGQLQAAFDLSGLTVAPNPQSTWDAILDPTVGAEYLRTIQVQTTKEKFDPPQNQPDAQIVAIVVEFRGGDTVELNADTLVRNAGVRSPISDYILRRVDQGQYQYRVTIVRKSGNQKDANWQTASAGILFPDVN